MIVYVTDQRKGNGGKTLKGEIKKQRQRKKEGNK
jgi:hypothetical protein